MKRLAATSVACASQNEYRPAETGPSPGAASRGLCCHRSTHARSEIRMIDGDWVGGSARGLAKTATRSLKHQVTEYGGSALRSATERSRTKVSAVPPDWCRRALPPQLCSASRARAVAVPGELTRYRR